MPTRRPAKEVAWKTDGFAHWVWGPFANLLIKRTYWKHGHTLATRKAHKHHTGQTDSQRCPCMAFKAADDYWHRNQIWLRPIWNAALKIKGKSGYELFMKEAVTLCWRTGKLPLCPSPSGGFTRKYLIPGPDEMPPPGDWIGKAPAPPAPPAFCLTTFDDDFNRPDESPLGTPYVATSLGHPGLQIRSGALTADSSPWGLAGGTYRHTKWACARDHAAQIHFPSIAASDINPAGVILRSDAEMTHNIRAGLYAAGASLYVSLQYQIGNGIYWITGGIVSGVGLGAHTLRAEIRGTHIRLYVDANLSLEADSDQGTPGDAYPGFFMNADDPFVPRQADNFRCDLSTP